MGNALCLDRVNCGGAPLATHNARRRFDPELQSDGHDSCEMPVADDSVIKTNARAAVMAQTGL
ncbi:MAG: hypothetical protein ACI8RE_000319 [Ilumatobacter sp.]|jgi:hypothetical protein